MNSIEEEGSGHTRGEQIASGSLQDRDFPSSQEESIGRSVDESSATQSHRVIILGDAEVGKTILLHKFLSQDDVNSYESEKGEPITKIASIIKFFPFEFVQIQILSKVCVSCWRVLCANW